MAASHTLARDYVSVCARQWHFIQRRCAAKSDDHDQSCLWSHTINNDLIAIKSWSRQALITHCGN